MKRIFLLFFLLFAIRAESATITVCAAGCTNTNTQLQTALNNAAAGDFILLQTNITYTGDFIIKAKSCVANNDTCYVTIKTGVNATGGLLSPSLFPAADIRITPTYSSVLAKIVPSSNNAGAFTTEVPPATVPKYYKFQWLELKGNTYGGGALLILGGDDRTVWTDNSKIPDRFIVDQLYIHSRPEVGQHRGIQVNASNVTISNSYLEDIKSVDEGQVIWVASTPGPVLLINNYMDGGAETFLSGGTGGCCRQLGIAVSASPAPTTTSARLASVTDLSVGQGVTFTVAGAEQYTEIVSIVGNDVTFAPALSAASDVPGGTDWGLITNNVTITKNYLTKNVAYKNAIIASPTGVTASSSDTGGTLAAGTYYYRVVARQNINNGQVAVSQASNEVSATTTTSTSSITVNWAAVPLATAYYIYGRNSGGENVRFSVSPPTTTFTDTNAAGTAENVPTGSGTVWQVKNSLELKNCVTCLIEGNVMENVWVQAQTGYILSVSIITQNSTNDSAAVKNITARNNIIRHGNGALDLTGRDADGFVSSRSKNILFSNNLAYDLDSAVWGSSQRSILITSGGISSQSPTRMPDGVTIDHNTIYHKAGNANLYLDGFRNSTFQTIPNFIVTNNIFRKGPTYGLWPDQAGEGHIASYQGTGSVYDKNIFAGATCASYPVGTSCPSLALLDSAVFVNPAVDNYAVQPSSVYHNTALNGTDYGAIIPTIIAFTDIAISGNNSPAPPPVVYSPLVVSATPTFSSGLVGAPYTSFVLRATGGLLPYTWSLTSGTLPTGVTVSSAGVVAGSTTATGTYNFRVTATDSQSIPVTAFKDYQVVVNEVIFPEPRPDKFNLGEGVFFIRETAPTAADKVKVGDFWYDLVTNTYNRAMATSPDIVFTRAFTQVIPLESSQSDASWTMNSAGQQFLNSSSNDSFADLSGIYECRIFLRSNTVADGTVSVKFSTDFSTTSVDLGPSVSLATITNGFVVGDWGPISSAAKTFVRLGVWGISASNAVNSTVRNIGMVCR